MNTHFLTNEELARIDSYRLDAIMSQAKTGQLEKWLDMYRDYYPNNTVLDLLYTACGLSTQLVIAAITSQRVDFDEFEFDVGYCYYINFCDSDHSIVLIPGNETHQIIQSELSVSTLYQQIWAFKSLDKLIELLVFNDILSDDETELTIRKYKLAETRFANLQHIAYDAEDAKIFAKLLTKYE